jgi:ABC-2 type transport system permease protein
MKTQNSTTVSSKPFLELVKIQAKLALREPTGIVFGVVLPIILLLIFGSVPVFQNVIPGTSLTTFQVYIPILMVTVLIMLGLLGLPIPIVRDREIGWLRRISTTPVSPAKLLAAQVTINVVLATAGFIILAVGSVAFFGIKLTFEVPGFILSLMLATITMFSLGLVIAAVAPSQGAAAGMTMGLLYPLLFLAGIYVPIQILPSGFQTVAGLTPVGAAVNALSDSMQGVFPAPAALAVMAVYATLFGYLAIRYFKWE